MPRWAPTTLLHAVLVVRALEHVGLAAAADDAARVEQVVVVAGDVGRQALAGVVDRRVRAADRGDQRVGGGPGVRRVRESRCRRGSLVTPLSPAEPSTVTWCAAASLNA